MVELDFLKGTVLGDRYQILLPIGRGGMGAVYEALDLRLDRIVAIKVIGLLRVAGASLDVLRERFHREARAVARLQHLNVVTVHDFGTDPALDLDYLVMERLHGSDLAALAGQGPTAPGVAEIVQVLKGALRGVAAGHRQRLIHRDLKPANLFLTDGSDSIDQRVRVLDFGIAQLLPAESTLTQLTIEGRVPLSPAYASPEQLRGETDLLPASDVFSLGATAYYLLTGRKPFSPPEQSALVQGYPVSIPPASALNPDVPDYLDALLERAMAARPRERYADAGDMLRELETAEIAAARTAERLNIWAGVGAVHADGSAAVDDETIAEEADTVRARPAGGMAIVTWAVGVIRRLRQQDPSRARLIAVAAVAIAVVAFGVECLPVAVCAGMGVRTIPRRSRGSLCTAVRVGGSVP